MFLKKCHSFLIIGILFLVSMSCSTLMNYELKLSTGTDNVQGCGLVNLTTSSCKEIVLFNRDSEKTSLFRNINRRKRESTKSDKKGLKSIFNKNTLKATCTPFFITRLKSKCENSLLKYQKKPPGRHSVVNNLNGFSSTSSIYKQNSLNNNSLENRRGKLRNFFFPKSTPVFIYSVTETVEISNAEKESLSTLQQSKSMEDLALEETSSKVLQTSNQSIIPFYNVAATRSSGLQPENPQLKKLYHLGKWKNVLKNNKNYTEELSSDRQQQQETAKSATPLIFNEQYTELVNESDQRLSILTPNSTTSSIKFSPYTKFQIKNIFNFKEKTTDFSFLSQSNPLFINTTKFYQSNLSNISFLPAKPLAFLDEVKSEKSLNLNPANTGKNSSSKKIVNSIPMFHSSKKRPNKKGKQYNQETLNKELNGSRHLNISISMPDDTDNNAQNTFEEINHTVFVELDSSTPKISTFLFKKLSTRTIFNNLFTLQKLSFLMNNSHKQSKPLWAKNYSSLGFSEYTIPYKFSKLNKSISNKEVNPKPSNDMPFSTSTTMNRPNLEEAKFTPEDFLHRTTINFESQVPQTPLDSKAIVDMNPELFFQEMNLNTEIAEKSTASKNKLFIKNKKINNRKKFTKAPKRKEFFNEPVVNETEIQNDLAVFLDTSLHTSNKIERLDVSNETSEEIEQQNPHGGFYKKLFFNFKSPSVETTYYTHMFENSEKLIKEDNITTLASPSLANETGNINSPVMNNTLSNFENETISTEKSFKFKNLFIFQKPASDNTNLSCNFDPGGLPSTTTNDSMKSSVDALQIQEEIASSPCYVERCKVLSEHESFESSSSRNLNTRNTLKSQNQWRFWEHTKPSKWYFITKSLRSTFRPVVETEEGNLFRWGIKSFEEEKDDITLLVSERSISSSSEYLLEEVTVNNLLIKENKSLSYPKKSFVTTKRFFKKASNPLKENLFTSSIPLNLSTKTKLSTLSQIHKSVNFSFESGRSASSFNFSSFKNIFVKNSNQTKVSDNFLNRFFSPMGVFKSNKTNDTSVKGHIGSSEDNDYDTNKESYFIQNLTHASNENGSETNEIHSDKAALNKPGSVETTNNNTVVATNSSTIVATNKSIAVVTNSRTLTNESSFSIMAYVLRPLESLISVFKGKSPDNLTKVGDVNTSTPIHNRSIPSHLRPQNSSLVILALNNTNSSSLRRSNSVFVEDFPLNNSEMILNNSSINSSRDLHEPKIGLFDVLGGWFHCIVDNFIEPKPQDVHFYLFTRKNVDDQEELFLTQENSNEENTTELPEPVIENESEGTIEKRQSYSEEVYFEPLNFATSELQSKWFNILLETKILVHGYLQDYQTDIMVNMKDAFLKKSEMNVIVVDWSVVSDNACYPAVAEHGLRSVGRLLARLLDQLVEGGVSLTKVHIVGFSLGAHVAGHAGTETKHGLVSRITGLDPALPYVPMDSDVSLDVGDAVFVDIIHSAAGYLGQPAPMGTVDFYPNGGFQQPGCDLATLGACSHRRSALYFIESINSEAGFNATQCESWHDFQANLCNDSETILMGAPCPTNTSGKYFLHTGHKEPFAVFSGEHKKIKKSLLLDVFYEIV